VERRDSSRRGSWEFI